MGIFVFLLSWFSVFTFVILGVRFFLVKKRGEERSTVSVPLLLTIWTVMALAFNGVHESLYFTRYLTWCLLPFTFLVALGFIRVLKLLPRGMRRWGAIVLIAVFAVKIVGNIGHSLYVRKGLERIWVHKLLFRTEIYKDQTGVKEAKLFDVSRYWYPRTDFTKSIDPFLVHHVEREGDLAKDLAFYDILKQFGIAYATSDHPLVLPWKTDLLMQVDSAKLSLLTSFRARFTKKIAPTYYLYRVSL